MSWLKDHLVKAVPHLLDPKETVQSARRFFNWYTLPSLEAKAAEQQIAIEHEQAILEGIGLAIEDQKAREKERRVTQSPRIGQGVAKVE